jgi:UDP-3-O-[3-hydroxymyristoyl] glucosamine N-acyltransferase
MSFLLENVEPDWRGQQSASIAEDVVMAQSSIVNPGAVIGPACQLEPNSVIYGGVVLGARVVVGAGSVIGRPGFGFAEGANGDARRIPQLGGVVIGDDVEIGALCSVDAGTLSPTLIGAQTKLDAQVHVGHNVRISKRCFLAAQVGLAGSVEVGEGVRIGGQAGVADHVRIGAGARIAAKSGVISDVPQNATVAGYPAVLRTRWLRGMAELLRPRKHSRG